MVYLYMAGAARHGQRSNRGAMKLVTPLGSLCPLTGGGWDRPWAGSSYLVNLGKPSDSTPRSL